MEKEQFQVNREKSAEHWLELSEEGSEFGAFAKWDGCTELELFGTRVHVCDIEHAIQRLREIQEKAKAHFGKDWPE